MVGADTRCTDNGTSSLFAFVKVAQPDDEFGDPSFVLSVRTADGEGIEPIDSLQTLFDEMHTCTTVSTKKVDTFESNISIYPNPANDVVVVKTDIISPFDLELVNTIGESIYQSTFTSYIDLDVSKIERGIYFVVLSNGEAMITKRLVIE